MRRVYKPKYLEFLKKGYQEMTSKALTKAFNERFGMDKTELSVRSALHKHGIKCGREPKDRIVNRTRIFTEEHKNFIRWAFKKMPESKIAGPFNEHFGTFITTKQIKGCVTNHKIRCGRTGCFKIGNEPWNAGTKGLTGPNKGSFKKGTVPPNRKPMGFERISKDGFIEIKVDERNPRTGFSTRFKHKHRHVYEQNFGPIPDGMVVALKDSDPQNCDPDNLMLVSRTELLFMNGMQYSKAPEPIKPSLAVIAKLKATVVERIKEKAL